MGNVHMEATQINYRGGASKMNVEDAIKSAIELTPEQKTNINKIPTIEAAVATKTDQTVIAPEFDAESGIYAIGDLVMHEGKLNEFTSAHETAGDWNPEEVSEKTVADEVDSLKSGLMDIQCGVETVTLAASSQTEVTIYLPNPFHGGSGTDYAVVATLEEYSAPTMFSPILIRSKYYDRFVLRINNTNTDPDTANINWLVMRKTPTTS